MIGNIICAGNIMVDALADIEYTLGIRIIHSGGSGGPDYGRHLSSFLGSYDGIDGGIASQYTDANDENLIIINCVLMG